MHRSFAPLLLVVALGSCASFETTVAEFDGVTSTGPEAAAGPVPDEIRYSDMVDRYPWALRQIEGSGIDVIFTKLLRVQREPWEVEDPVGFARERIRDLAEKAPSEPAGLSQAITRLLLVAEMDSGALNRADALQGLAGLAGLLPMRLDPPPRISRPPETFRERTTELVTRMRVSWPGVRPDRALSAEEKRQHAEALDAAARFPWPEAQQRRYLIRALGTGYSLERDGDLRVAAKDALLLAMGNAVGVAFWDGVLDLSEMVREEALLSLTSTFGPAVLPEALSRLALRGPGGQFVYDPSPDVRRRLLHLCAALDLAMFQDSRERSPSFLEFVATAAMNDPDPGIQMVAARTLAAKLGRPVSADASWVREWWDDYVVAGRPLQASR